MGMSLRSALLIGNDQSTIDLLRWYLDREDFSVRHASSGSDALMMASQPTTDIVIVDALDDMSPNDFCVQLRGQPGSSAVPVIILASVSDDRARVDTLNAGADDCLVKPFNPLELMARVSAVMRRVHPELTGAKLVVGDVEMDLAGHRVRRRGELVPLGHIEFKILRHFLENPGVVFARTQLVRRLWRGNSAIQLRTIDLHIRRLRNALNKGGRPDVLRTVRAVGYSFEIEQLKWALIALTGYLSVPEFIRVAGGVAIETVADRFIAHKASRYGATAAIRRHQNRLTSNRRAYARREASISFFFWRLPISLCDPAIFDAQHFEHLGARL